MSFTIYPALDLRDGKVVRLKEGDPDRITTYSGDPAEMTRQWLNAGASWLHVVNLDGAFGESGDTNGAALKSILKLTNEYEVQMQFGGGMRSLDSIERAIDLGVSRVVLGTIAIEKPNVVSDVLKKLGAEKVAVGIDARDGLVRVRGWKDNSGIPANELALQMQTLGLRTAIFTDVSRDGLGTGLNIPATKELAEMSGLDVIASGGVQTLDDVRAARDANLAGVIIGRALYEGTIDLKETLTIPKHEGHDGKTFRFNLRALGVLCV
jgi:phosphoribosylformimino-5-aminoimidazole carboxamide ribotide isomerase